eukprot:scaffold53552_cov66-Phaeocystis_antarctica.AAC.2
MLPHPRGPAPRRSAPAAASRPDPACARLRHSAANGRCRGSRPGWGWGPGLGLGFGLACRRDLREMTVVRRDEYIRIGQEVERASVDAEAVRRDADRRLVGDRDVAGRQHANPNSNPNPNPNLSVGKVAQLEVFREWREACDAHTKPTLLAGTGHEAVDLLTPRGRRLSEGPSEDASDAGGVDTDTAADAAAVVHKRLVAQA